MPRRTADGWRGKGNDPKAPGRLVEHGPGLRIRRANGHHPYLAERTVHPPDDGVGGDHRDLPIPPIAAALGELTVGAGPCAPRERPRTGALGNASAVRCAVSVGIRLQREVAIHGGV